MLPGQSSGPVTWILKCFLYTWTDCSNCLTQASTICIFVQTESKHIEFCSSDPKRTKICLKPSYNRNHDQKQTLGFLIVFSFFFFLLKNTLPFDLPLFPFTRGGIFTRLLLVTLCSTRGRTFLADGDGWGEGKETNACSSVWTSEALQEDSGETDRETDRETGWRRAADRRRAKQNKWLEGLRNAGCCACCIDPG